MQEQMALESESTPLDQHCSLSQSPLLAHGVNTQRGSHCTVTRTYCVPKPFFPSPVTGPAEHFSC